jgi:hypothetical protein
VYKTGIKAGTYTRARGSLNWVRTS